MTYTTAYFASILGLLIIALALNVSRTRIKHKISFGDGGIKELKGAIRAHGNAIENVPFILILLFFYEVEEGNQTIVWWIGTIFTISRFLHAWGMIKRISIFRISTTVVTYLTGILLPVLILL